MKDDDTIRKSRGPQALSWSLDRAVKPIYARRGFAESRIITDWPHIVGKALAENSSPRKLVYPMGERRVGGTLHVDVYNSGLAMEMTYLEPVIVEKIATYFGYKAVAKLKLIQNPMPVAKAAKQAAPAPLPLSPDKQAYLDGLLAGVDDPELKAALESLGQGVL